MIKTFRLLTYLLLIFVICSFPVKSALAEDEREDKKEVDINLSPSGTLFDISNMKPGDWAPRILKIENSGSGDFDYQMQIQNNGEKKLYNELLLEIKTDDTLLYKGKLAAYKSLPPRKITSGSEEILDITIRFPENLGNDFQGVEAIFDFNFIAEGKDNTVVQVMTTGQVASSNTTSGGFNTPSKSTNIYNLVLVSSSLVTLAIVLMIVRHYRRWKLAPKT